MTTEQRTKTPGHDAAPSPLASPAAAGRTKLQRSPLMFVVGVLVLVAGAVFGGFMWTTSDKTEVVAASADVQRGQVITDADLTTVRVGLDPSLRTVPAAQRQTLIGKRAAVDLSAGTLLSPKQVTDALVPPSGMSVVAVPISSDLVPKVPILAGDSVRLVQTPAAGGELVKGGLAVTAEVVGVTSDEPRTVVDVLVPNARAAELAALAASGRVALVLDSRAR